jgi:hypothetical protein
VLLSEIQIGMRVMVVNGGRHQNSDGLVAAIANGRVGVDIRKRRARYWFAPSELARIVRRSERG